MRILRVILLVLTWQQTTVLPLPIHRSHALRYQLSTRLRSFVLCGQGSSLLWTPALRPFLLDLYF